MSPARRLALLLLLGCSHPDPEARLHAGDLTGAAAAYEALHGAPLDIDHPAAGVIATRAVRDPTITIDTLIDTMDAARLLERAPKVGTRHLDLSFETMAGWLGSLEAIGEPPMLVAVGRSEGRGDKDPYTAGGALPWKGGRIVGWARTGLGAFGASIDADPPAKLVVVALRDATGSVFVNLEHRDGAWWTVGCSDADAAARLVLAADGLRDYGAAALRARVGAGWIAR